MVKVPMYSTIKEIIGVLKGGGDKGTLIVAIKGFAPTGYMIGVLYSQKEEFLKGHYNVTIAGTPMPNSGFLTIHPETEIYVIQEANFDDYLTYLLSMGIRTLSGVLGKDPKDSIEDYDTLDVWFANRA